MPDDASDIPWANTGVASAKITVDTDGDGIPDDIENACGSNPLDGASTLERIDGVHAGVDDDLDVAIGEALPAGATNFDCDRDGYKGSAENHVYRPASTSSLLLAVGPRGN